MPAVESLEHAAIRPSEAQDDSALWLTCERCETVICEVEEGDTLGLLTRTFGGHVEAAGCLP